MIKEAHDILSITRFSDKDAYGKLGVMMPTKKDGCYKILLDYLPADPQAPILIIVGSDESKHTAEIVKDSWIVAGGEHTHRIYGYTPFGNKGADGKQKTRRERMGSVFSSSTNERIYMMKINQWPRNPDTGILAFETSIEERFEKFNQTSETSEADIKQAK